MQSTKSYIGNNEGEDYIILHYLVIDFMIFYVDSLLFIGADY